MNLRSVRESRLLFLIIMKIKILPALFIIIIVLPYIKFLQILYTGECGDISMSALI